MRWFLFCFGLFIWERVTEYRQSRKPRETSSECKKKEKKSFASHKIRSQNKWTLDTNIIRVRTASAKKNYAVSSDVSCSRVQLHAVEVLNELLRIIYLWARITCYKRVLRYSILGLYCSIYVTRSGLDSFIHTYLRPTPEQKICQFHYKKKKKTIVCWRRSTEADAKLYKYNRKCKFCWMINLNVFSHLKHSSRMYFKIKDDLIRFEIYTFWFLKMYTSIHHYR